MLSLTDPERQLLERLAAEGKATRLFESDMPIAKSLEGVGLLFLVGKAEPSYAVITPKGRHLLAGPESKPSKPSKPPLGFLE